MGLLYAILFMAVLIVLLNWQPVMASPALVTARDKQIVHKTYQWLRNSSFFTIPSSAFLVIFFGISGSYEIDFHYGVAAAVLPLLWHIGTCARLWNKNLFVFRHTQQALALLVLRSASAAFAIMFIDYGGLLWFVVVNGALWLFGGNWCYRQLKNNTCWLMTRKHEEIMLAEDLRLPAEAKKAPAPAVPKPGAAANPQMAQVYLDEGLHLFVEDNNKKGATRKLLLAFQTGTPEIRQRAVAALDKLGEVERF